VTQDPSGVLVLLVEQVLRDQVDQSVSLVLGDKRDSPVQMARRVYPVYKGIRERLGRLDRMDHQELQDLRDPLD